MQYINGIKTTVYYGRCVQLINTFTLKCLYQFNLILFFGIGLATSCFTSNNESIHTNQITAIQTMDSTTKEIIEHHFSSFLENDLKEILSDYAEESIIYTPNKEYQGLNEIESLFRSAFIAYPKDKTSITIDKSIFNGNMAYVVWHGETPEFSVSFSTATYIIDNGKIFRHTIGRVTIPKNN